VATKKQFLLCFVLYSLVLPLSAQQPQPSPNEFTPILASSAAASFYEILHTFTWGRNPSGNLIFDKAGNLYGTTRAGAGTGCADLGMGPAVAPFTSLHLVRTELGK
jgi:hypothetical protein